MKRRIGTADRVAAPSCTWPSWFGWLADGVCVHVAKAREDDNTRDNTATVSTAAVLESGSRNKQHILQYLKHIWERRITQRHQPRRRAPVALRSCSSSFPPSIWCTAFYSLLWCRFDRQISCPPHRGVALPSLLLLLFRVHAALDLPCITENNTYPCSLDNQFSHVVADSLTPRTAAGKPLSTSWDTCRSIAWLPRISVP